MRSPDRGLAAPSRAMAGRSAFILAASLALAACNPFAGSLPADAVSGTQAGPTEPSPPVEEVPAAMSLAGLHESEVVALFGDPAFEWAEDGARMWRYDGPSCTLLVFLYPDGVRHADVLGRDEETCLCAIRGGCT